MGKKKVSRRMPQYFFYRGDLHRRMHINRSTDLITAWNYPKAKMERYSLLDVKKNGKRAFTTTEVSRLMHRKYWAIRDAILGGFIKKPQVTYGLDENRNVYKMMWSEDDIMDLHEYFANTHIGRPRKDGEITSGRGLPSARELRAMIRSGHEYYIQTGTGEFVPTWEQDSI